MNSLVFAVIAGLVAVSQGQLYCTYELGYDYPGNVLNVITEIKDTNVCQQKCHDEPRCLGFTYIPLTEQCLLKTKMDLQQRIQTRGMISGRCTICNHENDVEYPGNDIYRHFVESLVSCQQTCLHTEYCMGYTFDVVSGSCWVKHTVSTKNAWPKMHRSHVMVSGKCNVPLENLEVPAYQRV